MSSRKSHIEQINRYHDKLESLEKEIDAETDVNIKLAKSIAWYKLNKHWREIDDMIEQTRVIVNQFSK